MKLFAFDLDGTLYMGDKAVPGAVELISFLREKYQVVFFTNNSAKTIVQVHEKLNQLGIKCKLNEVYTSASATADYLKKKGIDNVYVIGTPGFRSELKNREIRIMDNGSAENLVVGLDPDFSYNKLSVALMVLLKGGKFIACNQDRYFPVGKNIYKPGCGAMVGAIAEAAGKRPDYVVGKPNTYILSEIARVFGTSKKEMAVVGDSFESDMQMAINYKCKGILIGKKKFSSKGIMSARSLDELHQQIRRRA